jgi:hypothetical protein
MLQKLVKWIILLQLKIQPQNRTLFCGRIFFFISLRTSIPNVPATQLPVVMEHFRKFSHAESFRKLSGNFPKWKL